MASEENADTDSNPFEGLLKSEEARKELRNIYEREHAFSSGLLQRVFLTSIVSGKCVHLINDRAAAFRIALYNIMCLSSFFSWLLHTVAKSTRTRS